MRVEVHPDAEREFLASIAYYEKNRPGLGYEFAQIIHAAVQDIVNAPKTWPVFYSDIRRRLIHRFPFAVLYSDEGNRIYILAIMHLSREPFYWQSRVS